MNFTFSALLFASVFLLQDAKEFSTEDFPEITEEMRESIEWVFSKGGSISYEGEDEKQIEIQDVDDLPVGSPIVRVNLTDCEDVGNHQLQILTSLPDLKSLSIWAAKGISDDDLKDVRQLVGLTSLGIGGTPINGNGFRHLKELETLEELFCAGAPIKDISLTHLKKIPSLRLLGLVDTKVTDGGTETLASLELNDLRLGGCKITDKGLENLQSIKSLKRLDITRTSVTRKGITEFRKALPECEVVSDFTPPKPK